MEDLPAATESDPVRDINRKESGTIKLLVVALLPGTVFQLIFIWRASANPFGARRFTLFDDAMISMTYARTFADTGELVWFPGAPRVQGFTNPLWTLYLSAVHWAGFDGSSAALIVSLSGIVLILATATFVFSITAQAAESMPDARVFASVAAGGVCFLYPLMFWTLRGMEVGLLALVLIICIWGAPITRVSAGIDRRTIVSGIGATLGVLTRLDFAILIFGLYACCFLWTSGWRLRLRLALVLLGPATFAAVLTLVLQRVYYGEWLPNTYHLKVNGVLLQDRIYRGFVTSGKILPLLVMLVIAVLIANRRGPAASQRLSVAVLTSAVLAIAYSVWVGGDAWEGGLLINRYVSLALPPTLMLVVLATSIISHSRGSVGRWVALSFPLVALGGIGAGMSTNPYRFIPKHAIIIITGTSLAFIAVAGAVVLRSRLGSGTSRSFSVAIGAVTLVAVTVSAFPAAAWLRYGGLHVADDQQQAQAGLDLAEVTEPSAVIATVWAGNPAYYSSRRMVDMLGKSDRRIAEAPSVGDFYPGHNKWDIQYSIGELKPDIVFQFSRLTANEKEQLVDWGYREGCLNAEWVSSKPIFFRIGSEKLKWTSISTCSDSE